MFTREEHRKEIVKENQTSWKDNEKMCRNKGKKSGLGVIMESRGSGELFNFWRGGEEMLFSDQFHIPIRAKVNTNACRNPCPRPIVKFASYTVRTLPLPFALPEVLPRLCVL